MPIKFRPKELIKKYIIPRVTDPGNPLIKPKPVIELKAFSVVMDQKMFAEGRMVLKRLRTASNPYRVRVPKQTPRKRKVIELAESTKPTKAHARLIRIVNKPKAAALETLAKTTGLPSIEKKAAKAKNLTTRAGSSRKAVETAGGLLNKSEDAKQSIERAIENPGKVVTKGTEIAIRNPEATVGGILGKAIMVAPGVPAPLRAAPIGNAALVIGETRKKAAPRLTRALENSATRFHGSSARQWMENGVNIGSQMARHLVLAV